MGDTKKAIKQEIKAIYKNVLNDLTEEEQQLTSEEKVELREYIEDLSEGRISSFVSIFIKKKIREIIKNRKDNNLQNTSSIDDVTDDEDYSLEKNVDRDIEWIRKRYNDEDLISGLIRSFDKDNEEILIQLKDKE